MLTFVVLGNFRLLCVLQHNPKLLPGIPIFVYFAMSFVKSMSVVTQDCDASNS